MVVISLKRTMVFALLLLLLSPPLYPFESSTIVSVSGDVYVMTSRSRWERVYKDERLTSNIRVKTEKGSSARINIGGVVDLEIYEDSLFELNENFSERSGILSIALFYGSLELRNDSSEQKCRVLLPYDVLVASKGRFKVSLDSLHNATIERVEGRVSIIDRDREIQITSPRRLEGTQSPGPSYYSKVITENMDILVSNIEQFEKVSEILESLIEKRLSTKKNTPQTMKEIDSKISELLNIILKMNESKNRINMFAMFLRNQTEENGILTENGDSDVYILLDELKKRQPKLNDLKRMYNQIISQDAVSIFRLYDSIKNGKRGR